MSGEFSKVFAYNVSPTGELTRFLYTTVSILTIALGIGAQTPAIFSVRNAVLADFFLFLPVPKPQLLVTFL